MNRLRTAWKYVLTGILAVTAAGLLVAASPAGRAQAYSGYQYPCNGYSIVGYFFGQWISGSGYHVGEDVCGGAGNPVYATADGTVMYSARTPDSYRWGNLILIQSDDGFGGQLTSIYGHLSNNRQVGAGQAVSKGQLIGFTGPAYTSENGNWSAHLHFGIRGGPYNAPVGTYAPGIVGYKSSPAGYLPGGQVIRDRQLVRDYQVVNVIGHGQYAKNQAYYVDFQLRNTGTTTWHINGSDAIRLGTIRPRDRGSGFSVGEIGQGWSSSNRIALMNDTAPGQIGVFRAKFSNAAVSPGYYVERFAPVIDGQGWLADKDLWVGITVQPLQYRAQWIGQNAFTVLSPTYISDPTNPIYLLPGQHLNLKAYIKNTGDFPWTSTGPNPVRLGTSRPNDRGSAFATGPIPGMTASEQWISGNRASGIDGRYNPGSNTVTPTGTINPGEIAVFSFAITVPNQPGYYQEYFNPVVEGQGWLNDLGMWFGLRVLPAGYHYEWVTQNNPGPIALGNGQALVRVFLRNTGQANWPVGGNVRLATDRGRDRYSQFSSAWLSGNRAAVVDANATNPGSSTIHSGNVARFSFVVRSDTVRDGTYSEYFRPVVDGVGWMPEDYGIYVPVTVSSPARAQRLVSQTFSTDISKLRRGQEFTAKVAVRNIGTALWSASGQNPVRLATDRPRDRDSNFKQLAGPDPWISSNRASGIDGKITNLTTLQPSAADSIAQSEIAYLNIPFKVPMSQPLGTYNEYFNLVQEGQSWVPDIGMFFPLTVVGN